MPQVLFIAPNTDLFLFPASLAPVFVLGATFSLTQVEWKLRADWAGQRACGLEVMSLSHIPAAHLVLPGL